MRWRRLRVVRAMNTDKDPYSAAVVAFEQWANERQYTLTLRQPYRRAFVAGLMLGTTRG